MISIICLTVKFEKFDGSNITIVVSHKQKGKPGNLYFYIAVPDNLYVDFGFIFH